MEMRNATRSPANVGYIAVTFLVLLVIAFICDRQISDWCREHLQSPVARAIQQKCGLMGGRFVWPVLALALLIAPNGWRLAASFLGTLLAATAALHALKFAIGRARPEHPAFGLQTFHFEPFSVTGDFDSFPSGHSMTSFMVGLFIARVFPAIRIPILALATLSALTRVGVLAHYPSDIIAGAALSAAAMIVAERVLGSAWFELRIIDPQPRATGFPPVLAEKQSATATSTGRSNS